MQVQLISKFKKELMGIAILFIMFTHSTLVMNNHYAREIYDAIKLFTRVGVDIFFMLSGMGLYYSMKNDSNILGFYKRRFERLIPPCIIVAVCWAIISIGMSWETAESFVRKYSLITFYTQAEYSAWFVAAIIALYIVYPLIYKLAEKNKKALFWLVPIIWLVSFAISFADKYQTLQGVNNTFIARIPSFVFGTVIAINIENDRTLRLRNAFIVLAASVVILLLNHLLNKNFSCVEKLLFIPAGFGLITVFSYIMDRSNRTIALPILGKLGGVTLELYLVHEKVLYAYDYFITRCFMGRLLSNITAVIIAVIIAWLIKNMLGKRRAVKNDS